MSSNGHNACDSLIKLEKIISAADARYNLLISLLLNGIFLWDMQCILMAEKWRRLNGLYIQRWCEAIGEMEVLSTLSVIRFENPLWVFPEIIQDETPFLSCHSIGHPLLPSDTRVCNDVFLTNEKNIAIITGSNMSGKSTFLRSVGVNLVLAYAGAPVCAKDFRCSIMDIYTSMRIADNLLDNISSFYAELIRIKKIVEAVDASGKVIFLIDELFRGTNSIDRHDGAVAVLNRFMGNTTMGFISTHDLDLCTLSQQNPRFENFHFEEQYCGNGIEFDYILRRGPSTTRNAMFLIEMLEISESHVSPQESAHRASS